MMNVDEDGMTVNLFWLLAFGGLLVTAIFPALLILPIVAVIGLLAFKAYKLRGKLSLEDVIVPIIGLVILIITFVVPQLLYIAAGYALAKGIDVKAILYQMKK